MKVAAIVVASIETDNVLVIVLNLVCLPFSLIGVYAHRVPGCTVFLFAFVASFYLPDGTTLAPYRCFDLISAACYCGQCIGWAAQHCFAVDMFRTERCVICNTKKYSPFVLRHRR